MAVILSDVLGLEGSTTGVFTASRNRQTSWSTETVRRMVHKYSDGSTRHWTCDEDSIIYGQTGIQGTIGEIGETGIQGATGIGDIYPTTLYNAFEEAVISCGSQTGAIHIGSNMISFDSQDAGIRFIDSGALPAIITYSYTDGDARTGLLLRHNDATVDVNEGPGICFQSLNDGSTYETIGGIKAIRASSVSGNDSGALHLQSRLDGGDPLTGLILDHNQSVIVGSPTGLGMGSGTINCTSLFTDSIPVSAGAYGFSAYFSSLEVENVSGDLTVYPIIFNVELYDHGDNYDSDTTGNFTAPADGNYFFQAAARLHDFNATHNYMKIAISTSANTFHKEVNFNPLNNGMRSLGVSCLTPMTKNQIAYVYVVAGNDTKTVSITGGYDITFSGYRVSAL